MTNFDYLKNEPKFSSFADAAIIAEKSYQIDASTCTLNCRRAMEMAIKWMYSIDNDLKNRKRLYTEEAKKYFSGNIYVPDDLEIIRL